MKAVVLSLIACGVFATLIWTGLNGMQAASRDTSDSGFQTFNSALFRISDRGGQANDRYLTRYSALAAVRPGMTYLEVVGLLGKPDADVGTDQINGLLRRALLDEVDLSERPPSKAAIFQVGTMKSSPPGQFTVDLVILFDSEDTVIFGFESVS